MLLIKKEQHPDSIDRAFPMPNSTFENVVFKTCESCPVGAQNALHWSTSHVIVCARLVSITIKSLGRYLQLIKDWLVVQKIVSKTVNLMHCSGKATKSYLDT